MYHILIVKIIKMVTANKNQEEFPRDGLPLIYETSSSIEGARVILPGKGQRQPRSIEFIIQNTPQGHFVRQFRDGDPVYQAYYENGRIKVRHTGTCLCKINEEVEYDSLANYWIVTAREDMEAIRQGIQEKPDLYR